MKNGKIVITLEQYRIEHNISKYKILMNCKPLSPRQLNLYLENNVSRVDLNVLSRICSYLECSISDILEFQLDQDE